jgi:hypothetical protein
VSLVAVELVVQDHGESQPWWRWCLSAPGRELTAERATGVPDHPEELVGELLDALGTPAPPASPSATRGAAAS